jgi:hypothetical protein
MSWAEGIAEELERYKRQLAESRIHLVLQVPPGFSIAADIEPVPKTGGERIHIRIDGPELQMPR